MRKAVGWKKALQCFVLAIVLTVVAMGLPMTALAEESTLPEPAHTKSVQDNHDGTYTVSLDVTGKSSSNTTKTSANVIVVLDVSGSMNSAVGDSYDKVGNSRNFTDTSNGTVKYYGHNSDGYFEIVYGRSILGGYYWWKDSRTTYSGDIYKATTTRLDIAKSALKGLSSQLIGETDSTVKVTLLTFSGSVANVGTYTGGQATTFNSDVDNLTAVGGTWWAGAMQQAVNIANQDATTPTYIVFLSDGVPTYGIDRDGNRTGDGSEAHALSSYFSSAVDIANSRKSNVGIFTIYTGSSAATRMGQFASQTNSGRSAYDGTDESGLNSAFSDLIKTVETAISYTNVTITDTLNNQYFEFADQPEITCTKTVNGETTTLTGQSASYDPATGIVNWNLGNAALENNATYTISFKIKAKQAAYDQAALNARNSGSTSFETNSSGTLDYSTVVSVNGTAGTPTAQPQATYNKPSVEIPTSTITVKKTWTGTTNIPDSLAINVDDDKDVLDANGTMNADGSWTYEAIVAAGPEGHTYTVTEDTSTISNDWTSDHPDGQSVTLTGLPSRAETVNFANTFKPYGLRIYKYTGTGSDEKPLQNATFSVIKDGDSSFSATLTTDENGLATTDNLSDGTYTITETNVPAGYSKLDHSLTLTVTGSTAMLSDGTQSAPVSSDSDRYFKVSISNSSADIQEIPATGGIGNLPLYIGGMALVAGMACFLVRKHS
jgi:hypothetical protein